MDKGKMKGMKGDKGFKGMEKGFEKALATGLRPWCVWPGRQRQGKASGPGTWDVTSEERVSEVVSGCSNEMVGTIIRPWAEW